MGMSPQAVNSGKGFAFVDHRGEICPSGFLPIPAGNIRRDRLADALGALALTLDEQALAALESAVPAGAAAGSRYPEAAMAQLDSER